MTEPSAANVKNLCVLGHPVSHSKSPAMYNAIYQKIGLPWVYGIMDAPTEEAAQEFLNTDSYYSVNVTTPYKPLALQTATVPAASATLAQGANLLVRKDDELIAYNTDGQGCIAFLERKGFALAGKRVAVCGTGPTSLAIVHTAALAGADEILLLSRDKAKSEQALRRYLDDYGVLARATIDLPASRDHHLSFRQAYTHATFRYGSYTTSTQAIAAADLIVDATPLGMNPEDPAPFAPELLSAEQTVLDTVYGHGTTALAQAAEQAGCTFYDGSGMLVGQAAVTVQIVCDIAEVDQPYGFDELFEAMAEAAGFDCA